MKSLHNYVYLIIGFLLNRDVPNAHLSNQSKCTYMFTRPLPNLLLVDLCDCVRNQTLQKEVLKSVSKKFMIVRESNSS